VTTPTGAPASGLASADGRVWHTLNADSALFFSIETRDERRTAFSLDTFSDSKFVIATATSVLTLLLTTVFGPLQTFLKTTSLDARQWLICLAVALSIVVVSEIRKAVLRRRTVPSHPRTR
jgi:P-type Ca2+ transporter type 2C